ncbi:MAG TPA: DUF3592 domain-containing protein [Thermoguttaceae bacterium]|nr:DUF3592 domain-containing protein [Thermoguttaceae bacterium]
MGESEKHEGLDPKSVYVGTLVTWAITIVALFVVFGPREILRGSKAFGWRKGTCVVRSTAFDEADADAPALLVTVGYRFDGRPYEATRRLTADSRQRLQDRADLFLRPGETVDCRVNPDQPDRMLLDEEYVPFDFFVFAVVTMTALGVVGALVGGWWVRKNKAPAAARLQSLAGKVGMMFLCGFILVFCGTATVTGTGDAIRILRSLGWPEAEATIRVSSVAKVRDGKSWNYQLDLRYGYDFDGKHHEGSRWSLFDDHTAMRKALGKLKPGDVVTCYVNPASPSEAVLNRRVWRLLALPVLPVVLAFAACGFWSALRARPGRSVV